MKTPGDSVRICNECGAQNRTSAERCWLCGLQMADGLSPIEEPLLDRLRSPQPDSHSFPVATVLFITLVAVCLGVAALAPGLGIALAVLSVPALLRTAIVRSRRNAQGRPMTIFDKLLTFAVSLVICTVICVASFGTFVAICFPIGMAAFENNKLDGLADLGWVVGIVAGLAVGIFLFRWLWRIKD